MRRLHLSKQVIEEFFVGLADSFKGSVTVFLIGETSHVWEGLRDWTSQIELTFAGDAEWVRQANAAASELAEAMELELITDSPEEYIPLPAGHSDRAKPAGDQPPNWDGRLSLQHFDPYSVALRFIARGDETDYHIALTYMHHDWVKLDTMEELLSEVLPRFTSETIQQDPAEFRRKYKGLMQLWASARPGLLHRHTPA